MPTTNNTSARKPRSTQRKSAGTTRATTTARRTATATSNAATATSTSTTPLAQVQQLAERAVLVQAGAALLARDNLVATVTSLTSKYRTRAGVERELKRFERRGSTARNQFERQVRRARTQLERELRQRRNQVNKTVKQNRRRVERELNSFQRDPAKFVNNRFERLVSEAQGLLS